MQNPGSGLLAHFGPRNQQWCWVLHRSMRKRFVVQTPHMCLRHRLDLVCGCSAALTLNCLVFVDCFPIFIFTDHDGCCAGNRVNCNKEFSACLNSCDYWPASSFVIGSSDYYTGMCTKGLYRMSATEIWAGMDLLAGDCCGTSC